MTRLQLVREQERDPNQIYADRVMAGFHLNTAKASLENTRQHPEHIPEHLRVEVMALLESQLAERQATLDALMPPAPPPPSVDANEDPDEENEDDDTDTD